MGKVSSTEKMERKGECDIFWSNNQSVPPKIWAVGCYKYDGKKNLQNVWSQMVVSQSMPSPISEISMYTIVYWFSCFNLKVVEFWKSSNPKRLLKVQKVQNFTSYSSQFGKCDLCAGKAVGGSEGGFYCYHYRYQHQHQYQYQYQYKYQHQYQYDPQYNHQYNLQHHPQYNDE